MYHQLNGLCSLGSVFRAPGMTTVLSVLAKDYSDFVLCLAITIYFVMLDAVKETSPTFLTNVSEIISNNLLLLSYLLVCGVLAFYYLTSRSYNHAELAKLPGPRGYPLIGSCYIFLGVKNRMKALLDIADKYPIMEKPVKFWFSHRLWLLVARPDDLKIIYNSPHTLKKAHMYQKIKPAVGEGLFTSDVNIWKRHRKTINPTFNQKILDTFVPIFAKQSQVLVDRLRRRVGQGTFDVIFTMSRCTLDMVCDTIMGISFGAQSESGHNPCIIAAAKMMEMINKRNYAMLYQSDLIYKLVGLEAEMKKHKAVAQSFSEQVVNKKLKIFNDKKARGIVDDEEDTPANRKRFLDLIIDLTQQDGDTKWTSEELREEVDTLLVTGTDTTAATNSFVLMMLGMYPDIQDRVVAEIRDFMGDTIRPMEMEDLGKLEYLERVIKETLRIFPNGPIIGRETTAEVKLDSITLPAGVTVLICVRRLHLDPIIWGDDFYVFDPDRFLPERSIGRHPYAYIPFSGGPRNCIGLRYAMMAMKLLLATVVMNYVIKCDFKIEDIKVKTDITIKPVHGYKISIEERKW